MVSYSKIVQTLLKKSKIKKAKPLYEWTNKLYFDRYTERLDEDLKEAVILAENHLEYHDKSELVTKLLVAISSTTPRCATKTYNEFKNKKKTTKRNRKRKKLNNWWDKELEWLHILANRAYVAYRDSNWSLKERDMYREARRDFRARKRFNQKLKRDKTFRLIEELFTLNKENFWKGIAHMERNKTTINIDIEKVKN